MVSAYLRDVAKSIIKTHSNFGATESEVVRILDRHFTKGDDFHIAGNEIPLEPHLAAGAPVIEQAAQAIRDTIGWPFSLDVRKQTLRSKSLPANICQYPANLASDVHGTTIGEIHKG